MKTRTAKKPTKERFTYLVLYSDCHKKWEQNTIKEFATSKRMHDRRRKDKEVLIGCACCMPPRDVKLKCVREERL